MKASTGLLVLTLCCSFLSSHAQIKEPDTLYITEGFLNKFILQRAGVPQNTYSIKQAVLDMDPTAEAYAHMRKALNSERAGKMLFWTGAITGVSFLGAQIAGANAPSAIIYSAFGAMCLSYPLYLKTKSHVKQSVKAYNTGADNNKTSIHWQLDSTGIGLVLKF